jgi:hypothetical protein
VLDPHGLVERREVVAVEGRGHRQQLRVAVHPEARLGELQRAEDQLHDVFRRPLGHLGLAHLGRVASVGGIGPSDWIRQRPHPRQVAALAPGAQRRPSVAVHGGALGDGCPVEHGGDVGLDIGQLLRAQHPLEDVEPVLPVGVDDALLEPAVGIEADRTPVAEATGVGLSLGAVALHGGLLLAVVDVGHIQHR